MKELVNTFFATSKERVANPIIGTFIFSWIAFNWKPIIFIIISSQKIEDRIAFVDSNFSNIGNLLVLPLIAVILYVLVVPHINLLFEYLLEFSRIKRNNISIAKQKQLIENKKQLAIEEIKLEEAKTEFRERKNHNELVENLQRQLEEKDHQITKEIEKNESILADARHQVERTNMQIQELSNSTAKQIDSYMEESRLLRESLLERDNNINDLKREQRIRDIEMEERLNSLQQENIHLYTELNDLKRELSQSYNGIYAIENNQEKKTSRNIRNK